MLNYRDLVCSGDKYLCGLVLRRVVDSHIIWGFKLVFQLDKFDIVQIMVEKLDAWEIAICICDDDKVV